MRECSLTVFLLLMSVNGDQLDDIGQRQHIPIPEKISWKSERHDLQDQIFGSWRSQALHVTEEMEVGEQPRLWALRRKAKSTGDLQGVCDCLGSRSAPPSVCSFNIEEFGPVIINGTCLNGTQRRRRRRRKRQYVQVKDNVTFATPSFPDVPWCDGTQTLLLVSSGEKPSLRLSNVPSVWVCPRSLGDHLQELAITNVPEVKIAPGALAHRLTDFTLSLTGLSEELVLSRGALSVDTMEIKNVDDASNSLIENIVEHRLPPQVKLIIEDATTVRFESKSVLAPQVWVEVRQTEMLQIETQAVEDLSSPIDSVLHVSSTRGLIMKTRAAIVNSFRATNISTAVLMEESMVVMAPEGEVILRDVRDVIAHERAITLGGGASLELSNVSFTDDSNRALLSRSPLRSVVLRGVEITGSNTTSICLATQALWLSGVTAAWNEHSPASACLRFVRGMEMDTTETGGLVLCEVSSMEEIADPNLCTNPHCKLCRDPKRITQSPIQHPVLTHENETESSKDTEGNWLEEPKYLCLVAALAILALLLLLSYCLYRLYKCSMRGTYELPQTLRNGTFPRTIITPDNLKNSAPDQSPHGIVSNGASAELFVSYSALHDPSLQRAAQVDQQNREMYRSPSGPDTKWKESHQPGTCQQQFSLMTPEDNYSISSSEMTI